MSVLCAVTTLCARASTTGATEFTVLPVSRTEAGIPDSNDAVWAAGLSAEGFFDITFQRNADPSLLTKADFIYDAHGLLVRFQCRQVGVPITDQQISDNVGFGTDDYVEFDVSTNESATRSYGFYVTPRGTKYQSSSESNRYAPHWTASAKVVKNGYIVEMSIPFEALRLGSSHTQRWHLNFDRYVAATQQTMSWSYEPVRRILKAPIVTVTVPASARKPAPRADIYGIIPAGEDARTTINPGSFNQTSIRNTGIDATYPFSSSLAFVGAYKPDDSNLELDQLTIAPQEFRRQYAEYRPFFSQGANYLIPSTTLFGPTNEPFYSPSIGDFDNGEKLEGTTGPYSIGALHVAGIGFDDSAYGVSRQNDAQTLRIYSDGVIADHDSTYDSTFGIGTQISNPKLGETAFVNAHFESGTFVQNDSMAQSFEVGAAKSNDSLKIALDWLNIGPEYYPIDGYVQQNDIRGPLGFAQYTQKGDASSLVRSITVAVSADHYLDHSNQVRQSDFSVQIAVMFKNLYSVSIFSAPSSLATYADAYPYYTDRHVYAFDSTGFAFGYKDGSSTPIDLGYSSGPYGVGCQDALEVVGETACPASANGFVQDFVNQSYIDATVLLLKHWTLTGEYDGTVDHGVNETSQWLRRLTLGAPLGQESFLGISYRSISGYGGFASPGQNLAFSFHRRFKNQSELFFNYGSPAATTTLQRFLLKYTVRIGGGDEGA